MIRRDERKRPRPAGAFLNPLPGLVVAALACLLCLFGCSPASPPPYAEVFEVSGTPYERGFEHGQRFASKIRSLYAILIETNLVPFLNREQDDVAAFLEEYQKPEYADGQFSYEMMLQSGRNLQEAFETSHPDFYEELRGLADGARMRYDKILVLNTFVDTMMSFRSVTFFIKQLQAPRMTEVEVVADLSADGHDNNGDGQIDEPDDNKVKYSDAQAGWTVGYTPRTRAVLTEVPTDASLRLIFWDPPGIGSLEDPDAEPKPGDYQGMDADSIRILYQGTVYSSASDDSIQTALHGEDDKGLEVIFTPPGGFPPAAEVPLYIQAANISEIVTPPPVHPRVMRDERLTITTAGFGKANHEVVNRGQPGEGTQPPTIAFAVRDSASADGQMRLAQHFALLDSNISHKHTVLLIHRPEDGRAYVTLGWAGVLWGFSGMNEDGLACAVSPSDTLNNPFAGQVKTQAVWAKLLATGVPIGLKVRSMLSRYSTVAEAQTMLAGEDNTFGWNLLLADADRHMAVVELDSNVLQEPDNGYHSFGADPADPENLDAWGQPLASVGPDDLRMGAHFVKNVPDIDTKILIFDAQPQNFWSSFYYRSLRAVSLLGDEIAARYGQLDSAAMIEVLRKPGLFDERESMNASVFEPEQLKIHWSMGMVPATDGTFHVFDLGAYLRGEVNP